MIILLNNAKIHKSDKNIFNESLNIIQAIFEMSSIYTKSQNFKTIDS